MSNLQSTIPFILHSKFNGPSILNMAGTDDEEAETTDTAADDSQEEESATDDDTQDNTESQTDEDESDESDEVTDETPAGKAFAKERAKRKAAQKAAREAEEARIRAEAKAEATEELLAKFGGKGKPEDTEEADDAEAGDILPEDEKVIETYLRKKGIDPAALKDLPQRVQRQTMEAQIDKVCTTLEKKYAGSVPFNREKVLKYAVDNGFAAAMPNAPLDRVLELAHKEMNEDAFLDWRTEVRKKKKDAPTPSGNGTGKKKIVEDQPADVAGFRARARSRVGSDD